MADMRRELEQYNELVKQYHALDKQIDNLLHEHGGHSENLSEVQMQHYRELARQRDDLFNDMRTLEQTLFVDDSE